MDFNHFTVSGNIVEEITIDKLRKTRSNISVINFRIASKKEINPKEADYLDCTAFGTIAENIFKYGYKGQDVMMTGRICSEVYEENGNKKYRMYLLINRIKFNGYKRNLENED